jgi:hypothetical protein
MVLCGGTCPSRFESSTRYGCSYFLGFIFQDLTGTILSVVDDVLVDNEAYVVTSSILRICWFSLSEVLIGVGLRAYIHS